MIATATSVVNSIFHSIRKMMETKENEIWIGKKMQLFLDQENILNVVSLGEIDPQTALECKKASRELAEKIDGKINVLVDLDKGGKESPEARKVWKDLSKERETNIALYGPHPVAKILAAFYLQFNKTNNARFFYDKEQALAWLRAKK